ncbi:glycoside hydrolase family 43 protein [Enterococcus timonensis]|uniref:glycoside hydrolase family 43 protein n=1 Tax=Enterococcus timonensis TaxID=1852364 RepID=UPI0008DAF8FF|nr:glycoside hydrolase family 43 protein [Enterococcus timonensis]
MKNPIIAGFSPDPSICRVGKDYYLVNSSFSYFPGVPIYHSYDLENWEFIGNILNRESQLPLKEVTHSNGIFAPTIRYHKGKFHLITTNVSHGGTFIVTADLPTGPWSEPHYLPTEGIDPSLFFDENGHSYYLGTRPSRKGLHYEGNWEIWIQEIDLDTFELLGVSTTIWQGALRNVIWPEGPHLYRRGEYYYLLIAEGGTGDNHAITVARSKEIDDWYQGNPRNPILTHRHLGKEYPIQNVGHGDLVETADGEWFLVCLGQRPVKGASNLGRETFLANVVWENDWPVINPGLGHLVCSEEFENQNEVYDFKKGKPDCALFLRNPFEENYVFQQDGLDLILAKETVADLSTISYLGFRQKTFFYRLQTEVTFQPVQLLEEAGLLILQSDSASIRLVLRLESEGLLIQVRKISIEGEEVLASRKISAKIVKLEIQQENQELSFYFTESAEISVLLISGVDSRFLSTEYAGGFVGNTFGVYGSSNGRASSTRALFKNLTISELEV